MNYKSLRLLFVLLFALACNTGFSQEIFKNTTWGITMNMPPGWITMSADETDRNTVDNIRLDSTQLQAILKLRSNNILLLSKAKYKPEEHAGLIPTIKITVLKNPAANFNEFTEMSQYLLDKWFKLVKNGSYPVPPEKLVLDGVNTIYSEISFSLDVGGTGPITVYSKVCFIPMKGYLIQVAFMNAADDNETTALYGKLLQSLHINKSKYQR